MNRGGLCDACISPGACCKRLVISGGGLELPMSHEKAEHLIMHHRQPFRPSAQRESGVWEWTCYQLQPDGRCGIYETRPQLCRDFKPGEDPLCVHFVPRDEPEALVKAA